MSHIASIHYKVLGVDLSKSKSNFMITQSFKQDKNGKYWKSQKICYRNNFLQIKILVKILRTQEKCPILAPLHVVWTSHPSLNLDGSSADTVYNSEYEL